MSVILPSSKSVMAHRVIIRCTHSALLSTRPHSYGHQCVVRTSCGTGFVCLSSNLLPQVLCHLIRTMKYVYADSIRKVCPFRLWGLPTLC